MYDLIVIGGGPGGISCAKESAKLGAKVLCIDARSGLGGTCVNVGCIPKKLLYQASSIMNDNIFELYGWTITKKKHNWSKLIENIHKYINNINDDYLTDFRELSIDYINGYASFIDPYTIECSINKQTKKILTCKKSVIAVGCKPKYLGIPGEEYCITSDELFNIKKSPGKTLIIGASYIAMECGGFINGLGNNVTIMIRSQPLRNFDRQSVSFIIHNMTKNGINFLNKAYPIKFEKNKNKIKVFYMQDNNEYSDEFNTIIIAIGRVPLKDFNTIGLKTNEEGKIISNSKKGPGYTEGTSHPDIFAIGDILESGIELAPVAIMAGKLLARRLYNNSKIKMDYTNIPTTIFTPLEYSSIGLSENEACKKYGEDVIIHTKYYNSVLLTNKQNLNFYKIILYNSIIIGIHIIGKNSSEIIQGFTLAVKYKLPLFDNMIGIHPTSAEELFNITKTNC